MEDTKRYLVVGMGKSGIGAMEMLRREGFQVAVYDKKTEGEMDETMKALLNKWQVETYLGADPEPLDSFECIVVSPGVPLELPFLKKAKELQVEIIGELELAYRMGKGTYIAITGTNGKTTTTTLVGEIFRKSGRITEEVGNIGVAVTTAAETASEDTWLVTECSSFQLETTKSFHPRVSALLNVTPDHLDRHKTVENYAAAKAMIFQNQTKDDYFVVNLDDSVSAALAENCPASVVPFSRSRELDFGAFVKNDRILIRDKEGKTVDICGAEELVIPGTHNLENALAAAAVCYFAGIDGEVIGRAMREFQGVEHRLEFCGEVRGVRFVNDSKGTNPDASIKAIEAMKTPTVLIAGGYDKKSEFDEFVRAFNGTIKALVLMGVTGPKLKETAERLGFTEIYMEADMEGCVKRGFQLAESGDTVLLSPACASWGMYPNYEVRGQHFKSCVKELEK